jgi:hypothetical protein
MDSESSIGRNKVAVGRHPILCRWWLRGRVVIDPRVNASGPYPTKAFVELYVPWYAWPLELLHRIVFGSTKIGKAVAVLAVLAAAGCGFMTSEPSTPTQTTSLEAIRANGKASCTATAVKYPEEAKQIRQVLKTIVQVLGPRAAVGYHPGAIRAGVTDDIMAVLENWEKYLGPALAAAKALIVKQGWVDTEAMYYVVLQQVVGGCLEGLDLVLTTPTPGPSVPTMG